MNGPTLFDLGPDAEALPGRPAIPTGRTYSPQHPREHLGAVIACSDCHQPLPEGEIGFYASHIDQGWFALCRDCSFAEAQRLTNAGVIPGVYSPARLHSTPRDRVTVTA